MMVLQVLNPIKGTPLVIVVEEQVLGKMVDEPLVLDEKLVQSMIADELVLHMVMVVEEMCRIVEQLVKAVGDIVMSYTEVDDYYSME
ncbi:hypothetical protein Tco_1307659, partial [Tanacetum coccineum]